MEGIAVCSETRDCGIETFQEDDIICAHFVRVPRERDLALPELREYDSILQLSQYSRTLGKLTQVTATLTGIQEGYMHCGGQPIHRDLLPLVRRLNPRDTAHELYVNYARRWGWIEGRILLL